MVKELVKRDGSNVKPWFSKTLISGLIVAAAPFVSPALTAWIAANPHAYTAILGVVFAGLRLVTNGKVSIK